jgi:ribosomal protein S18 acetylase RimI-like enzyme
MVNLASLDYGGKQDIVKPDNVELRSGIPEEFRRQAAEIVYFAFQRKLTPLIGSPEQGIAIIEKAFDPAFTIAAFCQDQPVGIAGMYYGGQGFLRPQRSEFNRQFGWMQGTMRFAVFRLFAQAHGQKDMYLHTLAVAPAMRGKGVGTLLLNAVFQIAREKGFKSVSLEVVDTNRAARRLYERIGFVATHTHYFPYLRGIAGFSASTELVKLIGSDDFSRPTD